MTLLQRCDPYLAAVRAALRGLEDRAQASDLELARYRLYLALDKRRDEDAHAWLEALEAGVVAVPDSPAKAVLSRAVLQLRAEVERA